MPEAKHVHRHVGPVAGGHQGHVTPRRGNGRAQIPRPCGDAGDTVRSAIIDDCRAGHGDHRKGIRVPDDISLVGFDDLPAAAYTTPPLTTVRQPLYEMGRIAAAAVLQLINGEAVAAALPPLELVVRETTRSRPQAPLENAATQ